MIYKMLKKIRNNYLRKYKWNSFVIGENFVFHFLSLFVSSFLIIRYHTITCRTPVIMWFSRKVGDSNAH